MCIRDRSDQPASEPVAGGVVDEYDVDICRTGLAVHYKHAKDGVVELETSNGLGEFLHP